MAGYSSELGEAYGGYDDTPKGIPYRSGTGCSDEHRKSV